MGVEREGEHSSGDNLWRNRGLFESENEWRVGRLFGVEIRCGNREEGYGGCLLLGGGLVAQVRRNHLIERAREWLRLLTVQDPLPHPRR